MATLVAFIVDGIGLAIVVLLAGSAAVVVFEKRRIRREIECFERALPLTLDDLGRSLRSGSGLLSALSDVSRTHGNPVAADLSQVVREISMGTRLEAALASWAERRPLRSVELTVACISLTHEVGGSTVSGIESVATTVRNALSAQASARVQATQSRSSAIALTLLPLVVSGPTLLFSEPARSFMLHTPLGLALLIMGLVLDGIGAWCMSYLVNRSQA